MEKYHDRMEKEQGMRQIPTKEEREKKWDSMTAVLNNLKDWSWDVYPQFKLEEEDAKIIIEALEHQRTNILLSGISVKV